MEQPVYVHIGTLSTVEWLPFSNSLTEKDLCVYRIRISEFSHLVTQLAPLLVSDELARAARYHQEKDRLRFIVSRAILRILLGIYSGKDPGQVRFEVGFQKKPRLISGKAVFYNVSHSGDCVLIAISTSDTGVDVEKVEPGFGYQEIIYSNFDINEVSYINSCAEPLSGFYTLWTRKEALVKGTAKGIDKDFAKIPSLEGRQECTPAIIGSSASWSVCTFEFWGQYFGSVACIGKLLPADILFCSITQDFPLAE